MCVLSAVKKAYHIVLLSITKISLILQSMTFSLITTACINLLVIHMARYKLEHLLYQHDSTLCFQINLYITKTCLYIFDPLIPLFYIVKLRFTGVYIIFLISTQKHNMWYSLEPPHRGGSNEYHNLCFEQKYEESSFYLQIFSFWR